LKGDYRTRKDWVLSTDIKEAPLGEKILALTLGGVLVITTLTQDTVQHYTQWSPLPKRGLDKREQLDVY